MKSLFYSISFLLFSLLEGACSFPAALSSTPVTPLSSTHNITSVSPALPSSQVSPSLITSAPLITSSSRVFPSLNTSHASSSVTRTSQTSAAATTVSSRPTATVTSTFVNPSVNASATAMSATGTSSSQPTQSIDPTTLKEIQMLQTQLIDIIIGSLGQASHIPAWFVEQDNQVEQNN